MEDLEFLLALDGGLPATRLPLALPGQLEGEVSIGPVRTRRSCIRLRWLRFADGWEAELDGLQVKLVTRISAQQ